MGTKALMKGDLEILKQHFKTGTKVGFKTFLKGSMVLIIISADHDYQTV